MEILADFVKILLPASIVLYAMYLTFSTLLNKETEKKLLELKAKNTEMVLPLRLQAYERMCLFLERIAPNNLVIRVSQIAVTSGDFHQLLLSEIREEFNHNLSQQVYMSDEAWVAIKSAMEEVVIYINNAAALVSKDAKPVELAKAIFENFMQNNADPTGKALKVIKDEIRKDF
jgi:hypothetical protein